MGRCFVDEGVKYDVPFGTSDGRGKEGGEMANNAGLSMRRGRGGGGSHWGIKVGVCALVGGGSGEGHGA